MDMDHSTNIACWHIKPVATGSPALGAFNADTDNIWSCAEEGDPVADAHQGD